MISDPVSLTALRRALIVKLRHHGDVLLTAPVFSVLKRAAPDCEIDALVYTDTALLLRDHPAIAQVHGIDRAWKKRGPFGRLAAEAGLIGALRDRRYDLVVHLTEHRRGAWLARLLRPRWAVAPKRPERGGLWRNSFTHFFAAETTRRHTVERNLDALRRIGIQPEPEDKRVILIPGAEAETRVDALLAQGGMAARGFVHFHPASRWLFKCWPAAKVGALAEALASQGLPVVFTGAPDPKEKALLAEALSHVKHPHLDLSGQLSLKELAALTARARLFVGVDSAPMHIAAAMNTPVVALFGPSGEYEWGPWNVSHRILHSDRHPCRPCGLDGCGGGKLSECLTQLSLEAVYAACAELLAA